MVLFDWISALNNKLISLFFLCIKKWNLSSESDSFFVGVEKSEMS